MYVISSVKLPKKHRIEQTTLTISSERCEDHLVDFPLTIRVRMLSRQIELWTT